MINDLFSILVTANNLRTQCFVCGGQEIPYQLSVFGHIAINVVKILVPVILVLLGAVDMLKATSSQKEDEIKKAQMTFVKRLIAAVMVFFVIAIVQLVFGVLNRVGFGSGFTSCLDAFINGGAAACKCGETC